jgi:hypothetical protein
VVEAVVDGLELVFAPEQHAVELAHEVGGVVQRAVVAGWGEEEPDQRQVEGQGEGEDLLRVELPAAVAPVGAFDGGDAGLGETLAEEPLQSLRGLLLGQAP